MIVRTCGAAGRENAGVSSGTWVRIPRTEDPRFPEEGSSALGKSGPKARPRGVADGQQVEIPVLQYDRTVGTQKESTTWNGIQGQAQEGYGWKNRRATQRCDAYRTKVGKCVSRLPRKAAIVCTVPVP